MKNWYNSLHEALRAVNLEHAWCCTKYIGYGQTARHVYINEDEAHNTFITIYRDERGLYERPIHYDTLMGD